MKKNNTLHYRLTDAFQGKHKKHTEDNKKLLENASS